MSNDHKPTNKEETARITAAGGFVEFGRVNGASLPGHKADVQATWPFLVPLAISSSSRITRCNPSSRSLLPTRRSLPTRVTERRSSLFLLVMASGTAFRLSRSSTLFVVPLPTVTTWARSARTSWSSVWRRTRRPAALVVTT